MNGKSYIRILHAVPNLSAVDVYANGNRIATNLRYKEFTEYLQVPPGRYRIQIFPTGVTQNAALTTNVNLPSSSIYTIAAIGLFPSISLLPVFEPKVPIPPGRAAVRFSHLSPEAPPVDIILPDGTVLFRDVSYKQTTEYLMVPPSVYTLQARVTGTTNIVLTVPNVRLKSNRYYTVYAVGRPGKQPPLQVLIPLDGNTYINLN